MKKGQLIEVTIDRLIFPGMGEGVIVDGDKTLRAHVKHTLPGQRVRAFVKSTRKMVTAELVSVLTPAPNEILPPCGVFSACGGCRFQNISYEDECALKERMVLELFEKKGLGAFTYDGFTAAKSHTAYRNKLELSFGNTSIGGELTLGMKKRNSYYESVNADNCLMADSDFSAIAKNTREFFIKQGEQFYHRIRKDGSLRYLTIRKGKNTGEILINLVTNGGCMADLSDFAAMLRDIPLKGRICCILHTVCSNPSDAIKPDTVTILWGVETISETILGLEFGIGPFTFFQTNSDGAEALYESARAYAGDVENKTIFDLYCGSGTISQIVSKGAKHVTGIDIVESSIESARASVRNNNIQNCDFIAGDVLKAVDSLETAPDTIIVDPPREGINPKALKKIAAFGAGEIIYISCNPITLAADLLEFQTFGYRLERVRFHDMFPRTAHLETVVLLQR